MGIPLKHQLMARIILPLMLAAALQIAPTDQQVGKAMDRVRVFTLFNQPAAGTKELYRVASAQPWRPFIWEQIGWLEYELRNYREAAAAFEKAGTIRQLSPLARMQLGKSYDLIGNQTLALQAWKPLLENGDAPASIYRQVMENQRRAGNYSAASETSRFWATSQPENPEAQFQAVVFSLINDPQGALEIIRVRLLLNKEYSQRGESLQRGIHQALLYDDLAFQKFGFGRALASIGQWDLAQFFFETGVQLSPDSAEGWALLGEARQQNRLDGRVQMEIAYHLNPRSPLVLILLARHHRNLDQPAMALPFLFEGARLEPDAAIWQVELGSAMVDIGNLVLALKHFRQAVDLQPENYKYQAALARFCIQNHVDSRSIGLPAARKALSLSPDDPEILDLMGWILMDLGDHSSAERFFKRALELAATNPSVNLHLGQVFLIQGKRELAEKYLKVAANGDDDRDPAINTARRLINK